MMLHYKDELTTAERLWYLLQTFEPTSGKLLSMIPADPQNNPERVATKRTAQTICMVLSMILF